VHILSIRDPKSPFTVICTTPSLPALPRSLLLHNFGSNHTDHSNYKPHLLIGLNDGTLISYVYDETDRTLSAKMTTSLGPAPVYLTAFDVDDTCSVFACGSRAEVLYWDTQRLQHSPVSLKVRVADLVFPVFIENR
jgi:DNA damage-binding protein 1